jgi:hypothetical protein
MPRGRQTGTHASLARVTSAQTLISKRICHGLEPGCRLQQRYGYAKDQVRKRSMCGSKPGNSDLTTPFVEPVSRKARLVFIRLSKKRPQRRRRMALGREVFQMSYCFCSSSFASIRIPSMRPQRGRKVAAFEHKPKIQQLTKERLEKLVRVARVQRRGHPQAAIWKSSCDKVVSG